MRAYLTRRYQFAASHRLQSDELSAEDNRNVYGKCNNPHGHGHNYALEVTLGGEVNSATGMVCDLSALDEFTHKNIVNLFDQSNLSRLPMFEDLIPTTENLCIKIYELMGKRFGDNITKVRIEETSKNSFEYTGP